MIRSPLSNRARRKVNVAAAAIDAGLGVIAIQPKAKRPDIRFCPKGSKDATTVLADVRRWLHADDTINLAAVTMGTDLLVIDVDGPEGEAALKKMGKLPRTRETQTRDGRHLFFRHGGRVKGGSQINFAEKLDIIASGYVLLPESIHPNGGRYRSQAFDAPVAELPETYVAAFNRPKTVKDAPIGGQRGIPQGERDNRLTSIAGALRRQGMDFDVVATVLDVVNDEQCRPPLPERAITRIARSICSNAPEADQLFASMADVEPADVHFLWEPYFVRGAFNLLEGDPNTGKTYLLCKIAAELSAGRPLPGQSDAKPEHVIFMSAEDDPSTTIVKRLMRMEANLDNITYTTKFFQLNDEVLGWVQERIERTGAGLLIMDPLLAYMQAGIDLNKANETRPFLSKLGELGKATGAAIIGLRHITKGDKDKAIYSGLGSVDIIAAARSAVMIGQDPEDADLRAMAHSKHNLSERGPTLLYRFIGGNRAKQAVPKIEWMGEADYGADALVRKARKPGRPDTARQDAELFLEQKLADGPKAIAAIIREGEARGFSERTLRRARGALGIERVGNNWKKTAKKCL